jgi:hypothetical protein
VNSGYDKKLSTSYQQVIHNSYPQFILVVISFLSGLGLGCGLSRFGGLGLGLGLVGWMVALGGVLVGFEPG